MKQRIPFHMRGEKMSRIDAFSDVVFGFALTLIVVSLEVPHTYHELLTSLRGIVPFSICFALLMQIWYVHYKFFRRYGIEDTRIVFLNSALLFVILMFVYPLKFLWVLVTLHGSQEGMTDHDARMLLSIYGLGFIAVWSIFGLMYVDAWRRRAELHLNEVESVDTRESLATCFTQAGVGLLAVLCALVFPDRWVGESGFTYLLLSFTHSFIGSRYGKLRRTAEDRILRSHSAAASV
jgi:hypothetical protein